VTRTALFAADSVTVSLGGRVILREAYVDAIPGAITALVGRSGSGKTTLFNVMVGRRRPDRGQVRWNGEMLRVPSLPALARRGLVYHPDHPWLARHLSLADHFRLAGIHNPGEAIEAFGVGSWTGTRIGSLSGGELRLAELAFALALRPIVVLLDEPFRGLDPAHRERIARALRGFAEQGGAVLYADHDVESVRVTADRLFSMEAGATRVVLEFKDRPLHEWYHAWPH
jgi:ABC-type multidrug transport system ATPase subunit